MFASDLKTSSDTFDFKQFMDTQAQRHWLIINDAEFKLFNQHHVLQVPRVKEPSGGHILNWKIHQSLQDAIYHMIYLTVAYCVRHGSPAESADLTTVYTIISGVMLPGHLQHFKEEDLFGIKSLISGCHPSWINFSSSEHSHRCWAVQEAHHSSWHLMCSTMSPSVSQIDMSAHLSAASSVIGLQDSVKESTASWSSITHTWSWCSFRTHLVKRKSSSTQSRSSRSSRHSSLRRSSHHFILMVLISKHQHQDQCRSIHL